jgi:hypothetical protein
LIGSVERSTGGSGFITDRAVTASPPAPARAENPRSRVAWFAPRYRRC